MYFMNGARTELVNSEYVERFRVVEKEDACIVIASYSREGQPVTLARYGTLNEAMDALADLHRAICDSETYYSMPMSTGAYMPPYRPRNGYHGKKHARHGGS